MSEEPSGDRKTIKVRKVAVRPDSGLQVPPEGNTRAKKKVGIPGFTAEESLRIVEPKVEYWRNFNKGIMSRIKCVGCK